MANYNMFDNLLSPSSRSVDSKNTFDISNSPDKQLILREPNKYNMFDDLLDDSTRSIASEEIYKRTKDHELGLSEAFFLGLKDTYRGVKQMAGIDLEDMARDQKRIRNLIDNGDGLAKAAYFGGLILDPAMWLIPVLRGRQLVTMAKSGAIAGGLAGAFGYVDDESFFNTRTKQAFGGAITGGVLSPVVGKTAQFLKLKKLKKDFGIDRDAPDVSKLPEKDFAYVPLPGKEDITIGIKDNLEKGKIVKGAGNRVARIRREATITKAPIVQDDPRIFKQGQKVIIGPRKETGTIVSYNPKNTELGNMNDNYIIKLDKKKFESQKDNIVLDAELIKTLNPKGTEIGEPTTTAFGEKLASNRNFLLRGPLEFFRGIQNGYSKYIGKPAFDRITGAVPSKFGPEIGGGTVGAAYGFSTEDLGATTLDPESESNIGNRFSRALYGFLVGAGGMLAVRNKNISRGFFKLADSVSETVTSGQNKVTQKWLDDPDLTIAGLLARGFVDGYNLPKNFKVIEQSSYEGLKNMIVMDSMKMASKIVQLTPDERKVLYNMLEGDIKYDVPAKFINELRDEARGLITDISQKYVDLGLITEETFKQNVEKYLRRAYSGQDVSRIADEVKARGFIDVITPERWINEYSKIKAYKFIEPGKVEAVDNHNGYELFGRILKDDGSATADKATPELVKELAANPKTKDKPIIQARWQYTKQERLGMGEIEDAGFAIAETGRLMSMTLPRYDFYDKLSKEPFTKDSLTEAEARQLKYVKVPEEVRKETIQPIYGNLAGKFIPEDIFFNIEQMHKIAEGPQTNLGKGYRKLNQIWKVSKTAWNPTVHVNNVISNLLLLDLVDGSYSYLPKAANAFMQAGRGKRSRVLELAEIHGVFNASQAAQELGNLRKVNVDKFAQVYQVDPKQNIIAQGSNISEKLYKGYVRPLVGSKFGLDNLTDWYRREDEIFRLALFMDRLDKGYSAVDAAVDARKSFIDYNITAPAINWMRQYPTPFLAYTYRVIPILAETAFVRPWKYAKYALIGYMLNNGGDLLGGGDTEAERAAMVKQKQGRVFGLPFLPHRNVKVPLAGDDRGGAYMDITRYVPGGDILDLGSGNLMPGLPAPLQPSFGIAGDVLFPMVGFDLFGKKALAGQGVSDFDDIKVRSAAVAQRIIPNFPFVPGSYSTQRIKRARVGEESPFRAEESELAAFFNSVGFKYQKVDIDKLRSVKGLEFQRKVNGIRQQINNEARKFRDGKISREELNTNIDEIKDKFYDIRNSYRNALNIKLNLKKPALISEIPKIISDAVSKKTSEIFSISDYNKYNQFDNLISQPD